MKTSLTALLLLVFIYGISTGCQKKTFEEHSPVEVRLAGKNGQSLGTIALDLQSIDFYYSEKLHDTPRWVSVALPDVRTKCSSFDEDDLHSYAEYPVGRISRIRIKLGKNCTLVDYLGNPSKPLSMEAETTHAFVDCNVFIKHDKNYKMQLMLNIKKSLSAQQDGTLAFFPQFELETVTEF